MPTGTRKLDTGDRNWDKTGYLEVSSDIVVEGFRQYSLLDSQVIFAKGFFNLNPKPYPRSEILPVKMNREEDVPGLFRRLLFLDSAKKKMTPVEIDPHPGSFVDLLTGRTSVSGHPKP